MSKKEEWTPMHAAARIACGNLEGEASDRLERSVRLGWEAMRADDMVGEDAEWDYASESIPISTYRLWGAFGECSALRCELEERMEESAIVSGIVSLEQEMRYAYQSAVCRALRFMPDAVASSFDD